MKRFVLLLFFAATLLPGIYSSANVDSLAALARNERNPNQKLSLVFQLCDLHRSYAIDTLYSYANEALRLATSIDNAMLRAKAKYYLSLYYYRINRIDTVQFMLGNIKHTLPDNDPENRKFRAKADILLASTYIKENKQKSALKIYYGILSQSIRTQDSVAYLSAMNGIGWANMELGRFNNAIYWFQKGILTPVSEPLEKYKVTMYTNIASCYGSIDKVNIAKRYVVEGLKIAEKQKDLFTTANGLNILSNVYIHEKQTGKAIECAKQVTEIRKLIGDPFFIVSDMSQLAILYASVNDFEKGIKLSLEAIEIAKKKKIDAKMPYLYNTLSDIYYRKGDYKGAYESLSKLYNYKEQRYQTVTPEELEELQVKYETSLKENTIQKQKFELTRKNYMFYGSLFLLILGSLLGFAAYKNFKHRETLKFQAALARQREENAKAILDVEENERTRFASELHDGLGPMISAIKYNLSGISNKISGLGNDEKIVFEKAMNILDDSYKEVRQVSHSIMPNALLKKGLAAAVRDFISKIDNKKLQVHLDISGLDKGIKSKTEIAVYRIIQECVNNVIRHANATKLHLSLLMDDDGLSVTIEDNGQGFNATDANKNGIGLNNITTRVRYLQGQIEIDSRPGNGTLIAFHVP